MAACRRGFPPNIARKNSHVVRRGNTVPCRRQWILAVTERQCWSFIARIAGQTRWVPWVTRMLSSRSSSTAVAFPAASRSCSRQGAGVARSSVQTPVGAVPIVITSGRRPSSSTSITTCGERGTRSPHMGARQRLTVASGRPRKRRLTSVQLTQRSAERRASSSLRTTTKTAISSNCDDWSRPSSRLSKTSRCVRRPEQPTRRRPRCYAPAGVSPRSAANRSTALLCIVGVTWL